MNARVYDLQPKLDARAARRPRARAARLCDRAGLAVFAVCLLADAWRTHWRPRR